MRLQFCLSPLGIALLVLLEAGWVKCQSSTSPTTVGTTRPRLNTAAPLSVFWVTTVISTSATIQTSNSTVLNYYETQLMAAYTQAFSLQALQSTVAPYIGRRKRYAVSSLSSSLLLQLVAINAGSQTSQYNLVYYVQSQGSPVAASTVVTTMNYLSSQQLALYLGNVIVTTATTYSSVPVVISTSNLWIVAAVLGSLGGVALVVWFSLLILYRCVLPRDEDDKLSEEHVFAPRASSFRATASTGEKSKSSSGGQRQTAAQQTAQQIDTKDVAKMVTDELQPRIQTLLNENQRVIDNKIDELNKKLEDTNTAAPTKRPRKTKRQVVGSDDEDLQFSEDDKTGEARPRKARANKRTVPVRVDVNDTLRDDVADSVAVKSAMKSHAAPTSSSSDDPVYSETINGTAEQMQKILKKIERSDIADGKLLSPLHVSPTISEDHSGGKKPPVVHDPDELLPLPQPNRLVGVGVITVNVPDDRFFTVVPPSKPDAPLPRVVNVTPMKFALSATEVSVQPSFGTMMSTSGIEDNAQSIGSTFSALKPPLSPRPNANDASNALTVRTDVQDAPSALLLNSTPQRSYSTVAPTLTLRPVEEPEISPRVVNVVSAEPLPKHDHALTAADAPDSSISDAQIAVRPALVPQLKLNTDTDGKRQYDLSTTSDMPRRLLESIRTELNTLGTPRTPQRTSFTAGDKRK